VGGILLIFAIVGAILDRSYKKAGGVRPTRTEKNALLIAISVVAVLLLLIANFGSMSFLDIDAIALFIPLILALYEARRWQVRLGNPIKPPEPPTCVYCDEPIDRETESVVINKQDSPEDWQYPHSECHERMAKESVVDEI
jgi:hypothetical protein